jgi:formamidopyrimidine-DNA glycosylase
LSCRFAGVITPGGTLPELPEVEHAARRLRAAALGRRLTKVRLRHPALRRALRVAEVRRVLGHRLTSVDRVGKYQILAFGRGPALRAHFRMTGDWAVGPDGEPHAAHARAELVFDGKVRVTLDDGRALATLSLHDSARAARPDIGPDPFEPGATVAGIAAALRGRRAPIKVLLLDQRILAGVGNIYAAEALWRAKIDPRTPGGRLGPRRLSRLLASIIAVLRLGLRRAGRYQDGEATGRFAVYGREGKPCPRCGAAIRRIVQGGRSSWFCPRCQRLPR